MTFRPLPGLTIACGIALVILLGLGGWQVQRAQWKGDLLANIRAAQAETPVPFATLLPITTPEDVRFQPVLMRGQVAAAPLRLFSVVDGTVGHRLLVPVITEAQSASVLVDLGFVPQGTDLEALGIKPQQSLGVVGQIRTFDEGAQGRPDNAPEDNQWYWRDRTAMAQDLGMPLATVIVEATQPVIPGVAPAPLTIDSIPNRHVEYAFTWFALAVVMMGVYLGLHVRHGRLGRQPGS